MSVCFLDCEQLSKPCRHHSPQLDCSDTSSVLLAHLLHPTVLTIAPVALKETPNPTFTCVTLATRVEGPIAVVTFCQWFQDVVHPTLSPGSCRQM